MFKTRNLFKLKTVQILIFFNKIKQKIKTKKKRKKKAENHMKSKNQLVEKRTAKELIEYSRMFQNQKIIEMLNGPIHIA
jgi:hypothetical protein